MGALLEIGAVATSYGCLFPTVSEAAPTDTPVATQTASLEMTPAKEVTPLPTSTPVPTEKPELTLEQKRLLLGDTDYSKIYSLIELDYFIFNKGDTTYRYIVYEKRNQEKTEITKDNGYYVDDCFNSENGMYLFSLTLPINGKNGEPISVSMFTDYVSDCIPALEGATPTFSHCLVSVAKYLQIWEIDYNNNETLNNWADIWFNGSSKDRDSLLNTIMSSVDVKELSIESMPAEEIMPFWMYTPGATIPEELAGIYDEEEYPPMPPIEEASKVK